MGARKTMKKEEYVLKLKEYIIITLGVVIISFGLQSFYLSNNIAAGGLTGMALVINNYIPVLSVSTITFVCNGMLLIGAFTIIDKDFGFKTIYATIVLTTSLNIINGFLGGQALTNNLVLAVILGSVVMSLGLFILIINNASTGGTEIIAKILNKYSTINIAIALLIIDLFVTICGGITFGIEKGILAIIAVMLIGVILNLLIKIKNIINSKNNGLETFAFNEQVEEFGQYVRVN